MFVYCFNNLQLDCKISLVRDPDVGEFNTNGLELFGLDFFWSIYISNTQKYFLKLVMSLRLLKHTAFHALNQCSK